MTTPPHPSYQMPPSSNVFTQRIWQWAMAGVLIFSIAALVYDNRQTVATENLPVAPTTDASAEQIFRHAMRSIQHNDWQAAIPYLEQAAQAGHVRAQNNLGIAYIEGNGVRVDKTLGCDWIGKAAQQAKQDMNIQDNWGRCLTEMPQPNYAQAVQALTPPAQAGLSGAQFSLGNLYLRGQGVPAEPSMGLYWVGLAAAQGEKNALEQMGYCFIARECSKQYYQPAIGYAVIVLAAQRNPPHWSQRPFQSWQHKRLSIQLNSSDQQHAQNYIQAWQNLSQAALVEHIWQESGAVRKQP